MAGKEATIAECRESDVRHISMSASDPRQRFQSRSIALARTLAIPVAVLVAAAGCTAGLVTLGGVPTPEVRVVLGQEDPAPEPEQGPAVEPEAAPEPGTEPAPEPEPGTEPAPVPEPTAESAPEPRDPAAEEAAGAGLADSAPPSSYNGNTTSVGAFKVVVEVAYTDDTITNGVGSFAAAPDGWEYHIYRLNVTNEGSSPAIFDSYGTVGTTTEGLEYANDIEAEATVAWDYFWEELNPGATVTTHIMFLAPNGTEFAHVLVAGQSDLRPG